MENTIAKSEPLMKYTNMDSHTTLIEDTDWKGEKTYFVAFLWNGKVEIGENRRFHRVKISKRDYEKIKAAVGTKEF